ncbi:MAG: hypothetical protein ACOC1L_02145 [Bacillota bacterium]
MVEKPLELQTTPISTPKKIALLLSSGIVSGAVVFIFLYIWDGSDWRFLDSGLFANLVMLFLMGLAFATLYFGKEFKRIVDKKMIVDDKHFVFTQGVRKTTYDISQIVNIRYDRLFYLFIGYERITLTFATAGIRRKTHEVLVFEKGVYPNPKALIINHLKAVEDSNKAIEENK